MDTPTAVDHGEFVRIVGGTGAHQGLHEGRLAALASPGDDDRPALPAHDPRMHEQFAPRADRDRKLHGGPQAIEEIIHRRVPEALLPGLDQVRTTGLVTLPGAFIGVMLGGGTPVQAATAQVLVLFGIMAAQTITVVVAERLVAARRLLRSDLRAALVD